MWHDLTHLGISVPDKILRTVAVYLALAILLRLAGKRDLAQLNAFDLVVVLLLSNVVQNAVIGPDNSLTGGLLGAVVLIAVNGGVVRLIRRSDRVSRVLEGTPTVLVRDGHFDDTALRDEGLRRGDVDAALRRQNANNVSEVKELTIEPGGALVATLFDGEENATLDDIRRLEAKIDLLLERLP